MPLPLLSDGNFDSFGGNAPPQPGDGMSFGEKIARAGKLFFDDDYVNAAAEQTRLAGTSSSSIEALGDAADRRIDTAKRLTGADLKNPFRQGYYLEAQQRYDNARGRGEDPGPRADYVAREQVNIFNEKLDGVAAAHPDAAPGLSFFQPLTEQAKSIANTADTTAQAARQRFEAAGAGPVQLFVDDLIGGLYGRRRDPLTVTSLFAGPAGAAGTSALARIGTSALLQGLTNIGVAQLEKPTVEQWRQARGQQPGSALLTPAEVGLAFALGAIPGAGIQGAAEIAGARAFRKVLSGDYTPRDLERAAAHVGTEVDPDVLAAAAAGRKADEAARIVDEKPPGVPQALHEETMRQALAHGEDPREPLPALPVIDKPDPAAIAAVEAELPQRASLNDAVDWLRSDPARVAGALASERPDAQIAGRLADLSDSAWGMVRAGAASPEHAAMVHELGAPPEAQATVLDWITQAKPQSAEEARAVISDAIEGEAERSARASLAQRESPIAPGDTAAPMAAQGGEITHPAPPQGEAAKPSTLDLIPYVHDDGRPALLTRDQVGQIGERKSFLSDLIGACKA